MDRRRFSFVHWPDGEVRGAVVICPPLAQEAVCAHASLRLLAEQLATRGIVALRIDYDGTFNSIGTERDGIRFDACRQTIIDAVAEARSWGIEQIDLVGVRFGATLLSTVIEELASDGPGIDGVVLWDPVISGRRYSRELQLLAATGGLHPGPNSDGISVAGVRIGSRSLDEMKRIKLEPIHVAGLIVTRAERPDEQTGNDDLFGPNTEIRSLHGTEAALDSDVELSIPATAIVASIAQWLEHRLSRSGTTIAPPAVVAEAHEVSDDVTLVHRAGRVGSNNLFHITTTRQDREPDCAVIMLNNGLAPLVGPGRSWVELATQVARQGWAAVRVDLSGIGDSAPHSGFAPGEPYPVHAGADIAAVVGELRSNGVDRVAVVGLCSGALLAFDGALACDIDVIISINGRFDRPFTDARAHRRLRAASPTNRIVAAPLSKTPLLASFGKVPTFVWRLLAWAHIVADPTHAIQVAIDTGHQVMLVTGSEEWGLLALRTRGGRRFDALLQDPRLTLWLCPGLDHSMFDLAARAEVLDHITDYLAEAWEPMSASPA